MKQETLDTGIEADSDSDSPRVLTVVSCGATKQTLAGLERVPARELYDSTVHTCKDRVGRHSDAYYIMSAKFGLVRHDELLPEYDQTLNNMDADEIEQWAEEVATAIVDTCRADPEGFDAVLLIGSKTYTDPLVEYAEEIPAEILRPWQSDDGVTGVGKGMSWCTDESNWPSNVDEIDEIATPYGDGG